MDSLESLITRTRDGDDDAYGLVVRRFQDMAVGYGYSILRDFQLAEDAAQEAFFEAYRSLPSLREPAAFPGWFRRIVFKQCDRITRRKVAQTVPLDSSHEPFAVEGDNALKEQVLDGVRNLPEHERVTTLLFYISGYSLHEIGGFLDVPISTVKGRLHSARNRLREMLLDSVEEELRTRRPSRSEAFANAVVDLLKAARVGDIARVRELLQRNPRLLVARDPMGNTRSCCSTQVFDPAFTRLPRSETPSVFGSCSMKIRTSSILYSPEGFPPVGLAAHFGHLATLRLLLERGAIAWILRRRYSLAVRTRTCVRKAASRRFMRQP